MAVAVDEGVDGCVDIIEGSGVCLWWWCCRRKRTCAHGQVRNQDDEWDIVRRKKHGKIGSNGKK